MKTEQYLLRNLGTYFKRHKIATLDQLQSALGNPKERTVFRKLKSLDYLSSYSHRGRKHQLQVAFCNRFCLEVKVCHYPPGSSKWNPIEHRMFSFISSNWAGQPLLDYETVLKFIRTTKTYAGLKIRAFINKKQYLKGIRISDRQMKDIALKRYTLRPNWNYSICPSNM